MTELLSSLEASAFSTWVRESPSVWAYPTILTLHTLGLGVLVGTNWMVDLRVLGFARAVPLPVLSRAFPIMWAGFWLNLIAIVLISFFVLVLLPLLWGIDLNTLPPEFSTTAPTCAKRSCGTSWKRAFRAQFPFRCRDHAGAGRWRVSTGSAIHPS